MRPVKPSLVRAPIAAALLALAACGGWRHGYYSQPYFSGEVPRDGAADTPYEKFERQKLSIADVTLSFNLRNDVQTSDSAWITVVPVHVDLQDRSAIATPSDPPGGFCIEIGVRAARSGVTVAPLSAHIRIDGAASLSVRDRLLGSYTGARDPVTGRYLPPPPPELLSAPRTLAAGQSHRLELCFAGERPRPDRRIELDLARAVLLPDGPPMPAILFRRARYTEPYS